MPEPGKDRWNSLLETLGVPASESTPPPSSETPPEETAAAPAKQQPISMLRPEKSKAAAKSKPAKPAAKSPSYWSRIAGALGLESSAEPEPVVEPPPPPAVHDAPVAESAEPSFARHEEPRPSRSPRDEDAPPRSFERPRREDHRAREDRKREERSRHEREEPAASGPKSLSEIFTKKQPDVNVFGLGVGDEETEETPRARAPEGPAGRADDSGVVLDYDRPEEGSDLSFDQPATGERPFGDEEGEGRDGRRRRRRRGRGRGRGRGDERTPHAAERHESDIEPAGEDADFDFDRDDELDLDVDLGEQPTPSRERSARGAEEPRDLEGEDYPPRGERQPRHREERGEGRRDDDRRGDRSRRGHGDRSPTSRHARDEARPTRSQRPPARAVRPDDDEPDEDLHAAEMEGDEPDEGGLPTHKKLPTWEEAVNLLIDANMASRASNPDRGDRGRGRGRGRGR